MPGNRLARQTERTLVERNEKSQRTRRIYTKVTVDLNVVGVSFQGRTKGH